MLQESNANREVQKNALEKYKKPHRVLFPLSPQLFFRSIQGTKEQYYIQEQIKSLTTETSNCVNFQRTRTKFLRVESFIVGELQISYFFYNLTYSIQII